MKDFIINFSIFIVVIVVMSAGIFWVSQQGVSFQPTPNQQVYAPARSARQTTTLASAPITPPVAVSSTSHSSISTLTQLQTQARQQNNYNSTSSYKFKFLNFLGVGSSGAAVTELQKRLTSDGFYSGSITGYYGVQTKSAVIAFQKMHGIVTKGYVGPNTRAVLNGE